MVQGTSVWENFKTSCLTGGDDAILSNKIGESDVEKQSLSSTSSVKEFDAKDMPSENFKYPFTELFMWACLNQREKLAKFMWLNGEDALAKSLVAVSGWFT